MPKTKTSGHGRTKPPSRYTGESRTLNEYDWGQGNISLTKIGPAGIHKGTCIFQLHSVWAYSMGRTLALGSSPVKVIKLESRIELTDDGPSEDGAIIADYIPMDMRNVRPHARWTHCAQCLLRVYHRAALNACFLAGSCCNPNPVVRGVVLTSTTTF